MPKYGKGLNIEFANAVKAGIIREPFNTNDVRGFANTRGWNPPDNYINVLLPNGSAETHSHTYKKLFVSVGDGLYVLSEIARKE